MADQHPTKWHENYFRSERIYMLNDGVYAIVLTLLVLDLHIPTLVQADSSQELWLATKKMLPHFWSFFITFLWLANQWVSGQSFSRLIARVDPVVIWLQIFMLLLACLYPFPTALMGQYPYNSLGVVYFGIITVLGAFAVIGITQYTIRKKLISEHVDLEALKKKVNIIPKLLPIYLIPIAIAFFYPVIAQIIYFLLGASWIFQTSNWKLKETAK